MSSLAGYCYVHQVDKGYCYAHQEDVYMSLRQMTDYDLNERNRVTCFCVIFRRCIGD